LDQRVKNTYEKEVKSKAYKTARQDFDDNLKPFETTHSKIQTNVERADVDEPHWTSIISKKGMAFQL